MASFMAHVSYKFSIRPPDFYHNSNCKYLSFSSQIISHKQTWFTCMSNNRNHTMVHTKKQNSSFITCSAANKPSPPEISSAAKIRSEVLSPFRSVRMFFYLAFIASGAMGGLIATTQLIAALTNPARGAQASDILKGLGIDIGAVSLFAFLYYRENNAKKAQLARLSREESLSNLKLRVDDKRIISVNALRGIARLVICAGPGSYILESFRLSEPFTQSLLDRGVLVVPFATDGNLPSFEFDESEEMKEVTAKRKRLWQLNPTYITEWSKWLDEQKKLAGVSLESPVYVPFYVFVPLIIFL
ncbi:hypothetical protein MANES_13G042300v8 [Manihot esculenta]|uniref:Protein LOW PSII ACCUMULATION 1, chloroplastic n=1 Tax=Manihot esculenta TaxID=3983 RepID=A0A2C9UQQ3_MANES|nr:hypothetical protein MANES_13G042300v8 [Manihot esculenta]